MSPREPMPGTKALRREYWKAQFERQKSRAERAEAELDSLREQVATLTKELHKAGDVIEALQDDGVRRIEQVATLTKERDLALGTAAAYSEGAEDWAEAGRAAYRERDAAKEEAARLREALEGLRSDCDRDRYCDHAAAPCDRCDAAASALASTDSTDWLRGYAMRVAERVAEAACGDHSNCDVMECKSPPVLAAIVAEVKP